MEGYDEDRSGAPARVGLGDNDASSSLMCPPDSEVVFCDGGGGRPPGAVYIYTVGVLRREKVLEFKHPWCGGGRRSHRRIGDDREDGAPVPRRVLMKEDPTEPSGAEVGCANTTLFSRCRYRRCK